jgi:hypothetical protein
VTARDDTKRSIFFATSVKVQANSEKLGKNRLRWLNVQRAFLDSPTRECGLGNPLRNWNAQVLMYRHQPVLRDRFFKESALNGHKVFGDQFGQNEVSADRA